MAQEQEQFQNQYRAGRNALERGQYRLSVRSLEEAVRSVDPSSRLGGEVQLWLVTGYQAAGQGQEAIALCRQLTRHPHPDIRKQSQQVLYIIEAPQLKRPQEWMTEIPLLESGAGASSPTHLPTAPPKSGQPLEVPLILEDASQIETGDNQFIWVALLLTLLVLGGFVWAS